MLASAFASAAVGFTPATHASARHAQVGDARHTIAPMMELRTRMLGFSDIEVSELALGTQRWGSADFNAPDKAQCHKMLDLAVERGVNFVDTAEQYPIPSGPGKPEGSTEDIIGSWLAQGKARREQLVIASKITGGGNVTPRNIEADLEGTLRRLGTDYLDVYLLHWPARYTPQANWGQSLEYNFINGKYAGPRTSFEEIAGAMGKLVAAGKIRGWGMCNDNTYGLMGSIMAARELGVEPPCVMQNDYSIINRRIEENGLSEASAPWNEDVGFLAYNTLAGGVLTGKYLDVPASPDDPNRPRALANSIKKRGAWTTVVGRTCTTARGRQRRRRRPTRRSPRRRGWPPELSLRWCRSRSSLFGALGHTSIPQLEESLDIFSAPPMVEFDDDAQIQYYLPEDLLWEIDRVHMRNRLPSSLRPAAARANGAGEIGENIP